MNLGNFAKSGALSIGVELELQIVNLHDFDLSPGSSDLLRLVGKRKLPGLVTPEITDSMIELCTGVCTSHAEVLSQLTEIRDALVQCAAQLNLGLSGGGTHPFQHWSERRIYDTPRFHRVAELYGYLSKQFTIFGQHVHISCPGPDQALVLTWDEFKIYFDNMARTGVVRSMRDFYWDIRPKPECGTIEVRVLDTPLTIQKAAVLAGLVQGLARWISLEQPFEPAEDEYLSYTFNRFQACRFGLGGTWIRGVAKREHLLPEVVRQQCRRWAGQSA